ncbi:MAG: PH domain-containing protein, partial [Planctomycetota bacterium]
MSEPTTVREATFDPKVKSYYMLGLLFISVISIIGIPLLVITVPLGLLFVGRWVDRLRCVLTDRTLEIEKGILTRTESTIPLEKITDLQMVQGPIMRMLGLRAFKVETAGQTNPAGAMMMLV